jgi:hypothetical protein
MLKGGIDEWGVGYDSPFPWLEMNQRQQILELRKIREVNMLALSWQ